MKENKFDDAQNVIGNGLKRTTVPDHGTHGALKVLVKELLVEQKKRAANRFYIKL